MPNGKSGDAPWSDFFVHNREVFPPDIAAMLRAIYAIDHKLIQHFADSDMWSWEQGNELDDARAKLSQIMVDNDISCD